MNSMSRNGYEVFDELIDRLVVEHHDHAAQRLNTLLHEIAWTTGSELIGELGLEILAFEDSTPNVSPELQMLLSRCMRMVRRVWPDIDAGRRSPCDSGATV